MVQHKGNLIHGRNEQELQLLKNIGFDGPHRKHYKIIEINAVLQCFAKSNTIIYKHSK
jgi:hypothetical protein